MTQLLVTRREAAPALGVSERTLDRLVAEGRLEVVRVGKRAVRFRPADLEALVEKLKEDKR